MSSPPGQEFLGVSTSHGPFRESYTSIRKSTRPAEEVGAPAPETAVSAERMRAALPSAAGPPALLQRALPGGGAKVVGVESAAAIPGHEGWQTETQRPEPPLPGASPKPHATAITGR